MYGKPNALGVAQLDQDLLASAAADVNATRCALPKSAYAGHCSGMHRRTTRINSLTTYHAACVGGVAAKEAVLRHVVAAKLAPECAVAPLRGTAGDERAPGVPICQEPSWRESLLRAAFRLVDLPPGTQPHGRRGWHPPR